MDSEITTGMLMHYGGAAGAALGILIILILSRVFAVQRNRLRNDINGKEE